MKPSTGAAAIAGLAGLITLAFRVRPRPAMAMPSAAESTPAGTVTVPAGLPAPVVRFYRGLGCDGAQAPVVDTFALWGRAWMRRAPLPPLPVTFWSGHRVGWSGRQRLAVTWFGLPVLRGVDD